MRLQDVLPGEGVGFPQLLQAASAMLASCKVAPDESVVVFTDTGGSAAMAEATYLAATNMGCDAVLVVGHPRFPSLDPAEPAVEAMRSADVVFDLASNNWDYAPAIQRICDSGTRVLEVILPPRAFVERRATDELLRRVERFGEICDSAKEMRILGPHGTDLVCARGTLPLDKGCGFVDTQGTWNSYGIFCIAFTPPLESVNGTLVFNGPLELLPQHRFVTPNPVMTEIRNGRLTKIREDNEQARLMARWFEQWDDPNAYVFSHAGAGLDDRVSLDVIDTWEGLLGAIVVGIGATSNVNLQGGQWSPGHMDGVLLDSTLIVDGRPVIEGGRFTQDSGVV